MILEKAALLVCWTGFDLKDGGESVTQSSKTEHVKKDLPLSLHNAIIAERRAFQTRGASRSAESAKLTTIRIKDN